MTEKAMELISQIAEKRNLENRFRDESITFFLDTYNFYKELRSVAIATAHSIREELDSMNKEEKLLLLNILDRDLDSALESIASVLRKESSNLLYRKESGQTINITNISEEDNQDFDELSEIVGRIR